jgi:hypothetical protein
MKTDGRYKKGWYHFLTKMWHSGENAWTKDQDLPVVWTINRWTRNKEQDPSKAQKKSVGSLGASSSSRPNLGGQVILTESDLRLQKILDQASTKAPAASGAAAAASVAQEAESSFIDEQHLLNAAVEYNARCAAQKRRPSVKQVKITFAENMQHKKGAVHADLLEILANTGDSLVWTEGTVVGMGTYGVVVVGKDFALKVIKNLEPLKKVPSKVKMRGLHC